jgi:hypothetical protein
MAASAEDIYNAAQKQLTALQAVDSAINAKIAAIKDAEWNTPLTQSQLAQIAALRAQETAVLDASEELSYVTMGALDKSDELQRLTNALQGVSKNLSACADQIAQIGGAAGNVSAISKAISGLVPQLQSLASG